MKTQQVSTAGLIVRADHKFLILKRSDTDDFKPGFWELPGGGSDYGETPQEAARREIKEESGIDVQVHNPLNTANYYIDEVQRVEILFLCTMVDENHPIVLSKEHVASAWVNIDGLDKYNIDEYMKTVIINATEDFQYWINKYF